MVKFNSGNIASPTAAPAECRDAASPSGPRDESDAWALYEDCRRRLLETEAELAKAKSTIAVLTSKIEKYKEGLEQLTRQL